MSTTTTVKKMFQLIKEVPQKVINYIGAAVAKIFAPRNDNYPETGTQPYEGDPAPKKHY